MATPTRPGFRASGLRSEAVVLIQLVLADKPAYPDLAQVVEEPAHLVRVGIDLVGVLVEQPRPDRAADVLNAAPGEANGQFVLWPRPVWPGLPV